MGRPQSPLNEVKKDTRLLKELWRKLAAKYLALLDKEDVSASLLSEVWKFIRENGVSLDKMLSLTEFERMKATDKLDVQSVVKGLPGEETENAELKAFLDTLGPEYDEVADEFKQPLND
jgi:hypothetical protein